jgi:hypothetical protein
MGQIEVQEGNIIIRDMKAGSQETVKFEGIAERMAKLVGEEKLEKVDFYELNEMDKKRDFMDELFK